MKRKLYSSMTSAEKEIRIIATRSACGDKAGVWKSETILGEKRRETWKVALVGKLRKGENGRRENR